MFFFHLPGDLGSLGVEGVVELVVLALQRVDLFVEFGLDLGRLEPQRISLGQLVVLGRDATEKVLMINDVKFLNALNVATEVTELRPTFHNSYQL